MRILYFAKDAPFVNSGYGKCCREICKRLRGLGHEVAIFATVGNRSSFLFEYEGIPVYPGTDDMFGEDIIVAHYNHFKADLLITQMDIWPIRNFNKLIEHGVAWMPYPPIDFLDPPQFMLDRLAGSVHVVAMNEDAAIKLRKFGHETTTIHHGIDENIYKILKEPKAKLKEELGFSPDTYVIGMVQANQYMRKAWDEQLSAVALFRKMNPTIKIGLYIHTYMQTSESFYIPDLVGFHGLSDCTKYCDSYKMVIGVGEEAMARTYNAFDLFLSATNGEGFGLPVIEAQACGVPVVATDCLSFPELVKYGSLCKVKNWIRTPAFHEKAIPDIEDLAKCIYSVYSGEWNPKEISDTAHHLWSWDQRIIQQWMRVIDNIKPKIEALCFTKPKVCKKFIELKKKEILR